MAAKKDVKRDWLKDAAIKRAFSDARQNAGRFDLTRAEVALVRAEIQQKKTARPSGPWGRAVPETTRPRRGHG